MPPPPEEGISLFLDLDGTLVDFADQPENVHAGPELRALLLDVQRRLNGRLAIVSGRSLAQLDRILGDVAPQLVLAGSHGAEFRLEGKVEAPAPLAVLRDVASAMHGFAYGRDGVIVEEKSFGVALHYRLAPDVEPAAQELAQAFADRHGLFVQHGKCMVELRGRGDDKGKAIRHLFASPRLAGAAPVFVGDDVTDEAGFQAAHDLGGYGVLVGTSRPSAARFLLSGPSMVHNWLKELCL